MCIALSAAAATSSARVSRAASAAEQIARASSLWMQMDHTPLPQKMDLLAEAWANLALVPKAWPNDANAVVRSAVMEADVAAEFGLWGKVVRPLTDALPSAAKTNSTAEVEERLGQAYAEIGDPSAAEEHYLAAERAMHTDHVNRVESQAIVSGLANLYARQNKRPEALQWFHAARDLGGQDAAHRVVFQTLAAEQALRIDRKTLTAELAQLEELIAAARRTTLSPADATTVNHAEQQADRIRAAAHM
jgi:tetratricopeptide (TPR) repeat protein